MSILRQQPYLFVLFLIAVVCCITVGQAQEFAPDYRLVEPSAADYVDVVDEVIANADTYYSFDSFTGGGGRAEWDALADDIRRRFTDENDIAYQQLITLYRAYAAVPFASETDTDDSFIPLLIEQWLAENPTNLSETPLLTFDEFAFEIRRFSNTGGLSLSAVRAPFDGAALFHQGFSGGVADFIVISDESRRYLVPSLPERMFGHVFEADDFNADGQSDFAYLNYDHVGNSYTSGSLILVTWNGMSFEPLSELHFQHGTDFDAALTWDFTQFDQDPEKELMGTQRLYDNYGCAFIRVKYFDWQDDGTLGYENGQDVVPESFSCLLQEAEQHLWQDHYVEAIELYEQSLAEVGGNVELRAYAQIHLGLAYLLTAQAQEAEEIFTNLPVNDMYEPDWVQRVFEAYQHDPRLLPLCQTIYQSALDRIDPYGISGYVEVFDGGFYRIAAGITPGVNLENISCDLSGVLASTLASTGFTQVDTPIVQLEMLGLTVSDSISADFDSDGDHDWLVWVAASGLDPLLFVAGDEAYSATVLEGRGRGDASFRSADLRQPDEFNLYRIITLPDGSSALANMDVGTDYIAEIECGSCGGGGPSLVCVNADAANFPSVRLGDLTIWHLEEQQFMPILFTRMCGWATPIELLPGSEGEIVEQFVAGDEFDGGDWVIEIRPVMYTWDELSRTFVPPPQPTPIPVTPTTSPIETPYAQVLYPLNLSSYFRVREVFASGDFASALVMLDTALHEPERRDESFVFAFQYYRALALEALNRPDEALAQHIAIYEADPNSAWGILARLHLEDSDT